MVVLAAVVVVVLVAVVVVVVDLAKADLEGVVDLGKRMMKTKKMMEVEDLEEVVVEDLVEVVVLEEEGEVDLAVVIQMTAVVVVVVDLVKVVVVLEEEASERRMTVKMVDLEEVKSINIVNLLYKFEMEPEYTGYHISIGL